MMYTHTLSEKGNGSHRKNQNINLIVFYTN